MVKQPARINIFFVALLISTILINPSPVFSQGARGLKPVTLSHGLSDLLVNVIYNDSEGYIWFGTESSLDRFDGLHIMRFPIPGDTRKSRRVLAVTEGEGGTVLVGTNQGLFELKKNAPTLVRLFPKEIDCIVSSFVRGKEGSLYIGTRHGIFKYNEKKREISQILLDRNNMSAQNKIVGLAAGSSSDLYALTSSKLWKVGLKDGRNTSTDLPGSAEATSLTSKGDQLFIGTDGEGVIAYNEKAKSFGLHLLPGNGIVTSLSFDKNGNLIVSTDGDGVFIYSLPDGRLIENYTSSQTSKRQLRSNSVYSVLSDDNGRLWIGYYQSGVDYTPYEDGVIRIFTNEELGSPNNISVRAFAVDDTDHIGLIGTPEGAIMKNRETGEVRKYSKPALESNLIFAAKYYKGLFYIGAYHGGMYTVDPKSGTLSRFGPQEMSNATVFQIESDSRGDLWAATSRGLYRFEGGNPNKHTLYTSVNSKLPEGNVYEIFFDSTGRGWICTENGVAVWNGIHLQTSGFPSGFINGMKIRAIFEDSDHNLYFAPDRGEMWKSDLSLTKFGPLKIGAEGRFSQFTSIAQDNSGNLWFGTDKGLIRYDGDNRYRIYNISDGTIIPSYTLSRPYADREGDLWFGSTGGLYSIDVDKAGEYEKTLKDFGLSITSVLAGNKSITERLKNSDGSYSISLENNEDAITVYVSDFSFRSIENLELEYMIEGLQDEWQWSDENHSIKFSDLRAGKYRLKIREAGNPDTEIELIINKEGGITWLWVVLMVIILAGMAVFAYALLQRRRVSKIDKALQTAETISSAAAEESTGKKKAEYRTTRLTDEECKRLFKKLETVMKEEKPYINPDLKSKDLAGMIDSSAHALSYLFNQYLQKSYYDYINEYRVAEFKNIVKDGDASKYTLTTLAERCGFSSRASFFRHFKAVTGQTPAEYLKRE